ncbi:MAG: cyclic nucleotide-binding domain-containing protein [Pseudomonadota bacterium]
MLDVFHTLPHIVGLFGVGLYLGAYFLLQIGAIRGQTYTYAALNLVAASCVLFDLYLQDFNLASALIQISWIVISLIGILRLFLISHRLEFAFEEKRFVASKLPDVPKHEARRFLDNGFWIDGLPGTVLTRQDEHVTELSYLYDGAASVSLNGQVIAYCPRDSYVGELTSLTGDPATATVELVAPSRYFSISVDRLQRLAKRSPELRQALERGFAQDARRKLIQANEGRESFARAVRAGEA